MEWISTKNEKPKAKYGYKILTWDGENIEMVKCEFAFYDDPTTWEKGGIMSRVTHWMECPKAPSTFK